jgi:hypothetical protein
MRKFDEIANAASYWNRARVSEPVFVLLGRDAAAPAAIRFWAEERVRRGLNQPTDEQLAEALAWAATMAEEREMSEDE